MGRRKCGKSQETRLFLKEKIQFRLLFLQQIPFDILHFLDSKGSQEAEFQLSEREFAICDISSLNSIGRSIY